MNSAVSTNTSYTSGYDFLAQAGEYLYPFVSLVPPQNETSISFFDGKSIFEFSKSDKWAWYQDSNFKRVCQDVATIGNGALNWLRASARPALGHFSLALLYAKFTGTGVNRRTVHAATQIAKQAFITATFTKRYSIFTVTAFFYSVITFKQRGWRQGITQMMISNVVNFVFFEFARAFQFQPISQIGACLSYLNSISEHIQVLHSEQLFQQTVQPPPSSNPPRSTTNTFGQNLARGLRQNSGTSSVAGNPRPAQNNPTRIVQPQNSDGANNQIPPAVIADESGDPDPTLPLVPRLNGHVHERFAAYFQAIQYQNPQAVLPTAQAAHAQGNPGTAQNSPARLLQPQVFTEGSAQISDAVVEDLSGDPDPTLPLVPRLNGLPQEQRAALSQANQNLGEQGSIPTAQAAHVQNNP